MSPKSPVEECPSDNDRELGELAVKVNGLERQMEKVLGDAPTSHASRITECENDRRDRKTATATALYLVGGLISLVVWVASSGVAGKVDELRQDLRRAAAHRSVTP